MPKLKGITWDHPRGYICVEAASQAYEVETGTSVRWEKRSLQAFADAPIERLADAYDLIVLDHPHVGKIAETGSLLPLHWPPHAQVSSLGGSLESYTWNGDIWAYPIDGACQMAVRRPDLQVPEMASWEAVLAADRRKCPVVTALLPVDATCLFMSLVASSGEVDLPHSRSLFASEANGVRALRILKALYKQGPSEAVAWNPIKVLEAMSTTDDFAYSPALFGYINYARPGFRCHVLEFAGLPGFQGQGTSRGILGGAGVGVSSRTGYPNAARAFATWLASEPVQSGIFLENEGQPADGRTWRKMRSDPRYAGFLDGGYCAMENAWTRPRDVWFLDFVDDVCEIFPDFFRKDQDEEHFLGHMNDFYQRRSKQEVLLCQPL